MRKVQNQKEMKLNNLVNILDYLKKNDIAVKSVLARELGLSVVTITRICDDLAEAGILEYTGERESTGGRKPVGVCLIPDSRVIIALDLSEKDQAYLGVMNMAYEEVASEVVRISDRWNLNDFLQALKGKLEALQELQMTVILLLSAVANSSISTGLKRIRLFSNYFIRLVSDKLRRIIC